MTHDELVAKLNFDHWSIEEVKAVKALRAVVELHKPLSDRMPFCSECVTIHQGEPDVIYYPCPTIQAIEKELG